MKTSFARLVLLSLAAFSAGCAAPQAPLSASAIAGPMEAVATSGPTVFLLTIAPGHELFSAHGHTAIEVDEDRDSATPNVVYSYGGFTMGEILKNPSDGLVTLLTENVTGLRQRFGDSERFYENYTANAEVERTIQKDRLLLTDAQTRALVDRIEQEWNREGQSYRYKNYSDNCTTRVRDHLFLTVGGETLLNEARALGNDRSYETLSVEQMNIGARAQLKTRAPGAPGEIVVIPTRNRRSVNQALARLKLSLPDSVTSGEEFYAGIRKLRDDFAVSPLAENFLVKAMKVLPQFDAQIARLSDVPDSYDAMFLPAQLRKTLLSGRVLNPATGLALIDEAYTITHTSLLPPAPVEQAPAETVN